MLCLAQTSHSDACFRSLHCTCHCTVFPERISLDKLITNRSSPHSHEARPSPYNLMLAEGSDDAPGASGEGGRQESAQAASPASGMAVLARQLAQAKLSEAELQQRLRCALGCRDCLTMWYVIHSETSARTPEVMRNSQPLCAVCIRMMIPSFLPRGLHLIERVAGLRAAQRTRCVPGWRSASSAWPSCLELWAACGAERQRTGAGPASQQASSAAT